MRITVKATNITLNEALAVYLEQRLASVEKLLQRAEARDTRPLSGKQRETIIARVELGRTTAHHRKGKVFRAEVTLAVPGRAPLRAVAHAEDLRAAIDQMRDEVRREIRRWKEKKVTRGRKGARELKRRTRTP